MAEKEVICKKRNECEYKNKCPCAKKHKPFVGCTIICRRTKGAECVSVDKTIANAPGLKS